jgi:rod shape-determining protein MreC
MQRKNYLPFFLVFFTLSLFFILIGRIGVFNGIVSILGKATSPAKSGVIYIFNLKPLQNERIAELQKENIDLKQKIKDQNELISENKALRNQFETSYPSSLELVPAKVVGMPSFIPGGSLPEYLVIETPSGQNIQKGNTVVFGSNVVGKIIEVRGDLSKVGLVTSQTTSFAARVESQGDEITGILKGKGQREMLLDNILLTRDVKVGSNVLTRGEVGSDGLGYQPNLIIGKVSSVEKKPSDLFQRALVQSAIDFSNLSHVFVLK